jgi:nitrite reductase/ring-hydroxylating ferredoxin subunit
MKKNKFGLMLSVVLAIACSGAYAQAAFSTIAVNLNYPQYQKLKLDGGSLYIEGGGLKGIILYRASENSYIAYERACPYHPGAAGSIVQVDASSLFMIDHACRSTFNFSDGQPTGGPAPRALIQYRVDQEGSVLKISDEIIN